MNNKINVLAKFLEVEENEISQGYDNNIFEYGSSEYLVVTEEEREEKIKDYIKDSLWAFNSSFIMNHMKNNENLSSYEYDSIKKALEKMQGELCESANALIGALIEDIDEFIENAISDDGYGHFLSSYDGYENEVDDLYIYRVN